MTGPAFFPCVKHYYPEPLYIDRAEGCWVFDEAGNRYLDGYAGVATVSVGHAHPRVLAAVTAQAARVHHTTLLYRTRIHDTYFAALQGILPARLCRFFPLNSGSEAVDLACQTARAHRGRKLIVALSEGYHGGSFLTKSVTGMPAWQPVIGGDPDVTFVPPPRCRDCPESGWDPVRKRVLDLERVCSGSCLRSLEDLLEQRGAEVAAVLLEPVPGVGGILTPCRGFYRKLAVLHCMGTFDLICDEVQTGFGRLGGDWFGFARFGLHPDLLCLGKGIANGFPMGMVVATEAAAASLADKLHFSTFGGNPVSCAAALATLQVLADENLPAQAGQTGGYLLAELEAKLAPLPACREIRGMGLMIGVELTDASVASSVLEACFRSHLLLGQGGRDRNVLRIQPPLSFTTAMATETVDRLEEAVRTVVTTKRLAAPTPAP